MKRKLAVFMSAILALAMCACLKNTAIDEEANHELSVNTNKTEANEVYDNSNESVDVLADGKTQGEHENAISEDDLDDPMYWKVLNPDMTEYKNPYVYTKEELDTPKYGMYWKLKKNGVKLVNKVAKELSDKNWDNIKSYYGYPTEFIERGDYISPSEREKFLFTVHGSVNDGLIEVIVIIGLSEEMPEGEVCRVIQMGNGREWWPEYNGYAKNEIVDAFTLGLWEIAYSY